MSIVPSPPHLPLSPEPASSHYTRHPIDLNMKPVLASSWRVLEQPSPPTLREILEAYKARGDGDREMLLAMLNAKSSEDQRLASYATLHRAMLDVYQSPHVQSGPPVPPLHIPDSHHYQAYSHAHSFPSPPASYQHSPPAPFSQSLHDRPHHHHRTHSSSSLPDQSQERSTLPSSGQTTRKRRRTSRSPPPRSRARASPSQEARSGHLHELPPSPYSSASSAQSSGGSPRSRESMAINSLLLNSSSREDDMSERNTSSERSTTLASRER